MKRFDVNRYLEKLYKASCDASEFHIYDHDEEESFQIVGKSNFMRWLNDNANCDRYSHFSRYDLLIEYIGEVVQGEINEQT